MSELEVHGTTVRAARQSAWRRYASWRALLPRELLILAGLLALIGTAGCAGIGGGRDLDPTTAAPEELRDDPRAFAAAVSLARVQRDADPAEPYWPYRLGELYAAADSLSEARAELRTALDRDPDYAPAVALLSKLQYQQGDHASAVALLEGFLARNPDSQPALRAALAVHLEALGELDLAEAALDAAGDDDPVVATARTFVGLRGDDYLDTLETARRTLEENPSSAANHNNYGICLLYAGDPNQAREAFRTALEIDADLPGALYNMAIVEATYFFDEDSGRAYFARYRQVASADPDDLATLLGEEMTSLDEGGRP